MDEKTVLIKILKDSKIKKASLFAEYLGSIENYLTIDESALGSIEWVDTKGKYIPMLPKKEIDCFITKREQVFSDHEGHEIEYLEKLAKELYYHSPLRELISKFTSSRSKTKIALKLCSFSESSPDKFIEEIIHDLDEGEKKEIISFFEKSDDKKLDQYVSISEETDAIVDFLFMLLSIKTGKEYDSDIIEDFNKNVMINWFDLLKESLTIKDIYEICIEETDDDIVNSTTDNVSKLFKLNNTNRNITILFIKEILKLRGAVPEMAQNAINTGNPFLFRSLFLNFDEATEFAAVGKLNSSLETKYGNLFEELMLVFKNGRGLRNGGIDVVIGRDSFDIKSGPNVMNKSQVDAFSMKQKLIEEEGFLPSVDSYKIALGYGKREQLNPFMSTIYLRILD